MTRGRFHQNIRSINGPDTRPRFIWQRRERDGSRCGELCYSTWNEMPSCSEAARRLGPTSCSATAMSAPRVWAAASTSTIPADSPWTCWRWRCCRPAIDHARSRRCRISISGGNVTSWARTVPASTWAGPRPAPKASRGGPGAANELLSRKSPSPVVASPVAIPPRSWGALAGQDVPQQMVIDDDRAHSRRSKIGVVEAFHVLAMLLSRERVRQKPLTRPGREQHDSVAQVDDRDAAPLGEPPTDDESEPVRTSARYSRPGTPQDQPAHAPPLGHFRPYQVLRVEVAARCRSDTRSPRRPRRSRPPPPPSWHRRPTSHAIRSHSAPRSPSHVLGPSDSPRT